MGRLSLEERVWKKIDKTENHWLWLGVFSSRGQPVYNGSPAIRIVWGIIRGNLESRLYNKCDNSSCVNPEHFSPVNKYETTEEYRKILLERKKDFYYKNVYQLRELSKNRMAEIRRTDSEYGRDRRKASLAANPRYDEMGKLRGYGLTLDDYDAMLEQQGGLCAICGKPETGTLNGYPKKLAVDHHPRGTKRDVRGLLCASCNGGLGVFSDNTSLMWKAIQYVMKNNIKFYNKEII